MVEFNMFYFFVFFGWNSFSYYTIMVPVYLFVTMVILFKTVFLKIYLFLHWKSALERIILLKNILTGDTFSVFKKMEGVLNYSLLTKQYLKSQFYFRE